MRPIDQIKRDLAKAEAEAAKSAPNHNVAVLRNKRVGILQDELDKAERARAATVRVGQAS